MHRQLNTQGILIALQPQFSFDNAITSVGIYLLNNTEECRQYEACFTTAQRPEKNFSNVIQPQSAVMLEGFRFIELNDNPSLAIKIIFGNEFVARYLKFKPKTFATQPFPVPLLDKPAYLYEIWKPAAEKVSSSDASPESSNTPFNVDVDKLKEEMLKGNSNISKKIIHEPAPMVIDLHIEAINPEFSRLPAAEILQIQMGVFQKTLERAIACGYPSLIAIHGVGTGILRKHIIEYCNTHPRVKKCDEPLVNKYGYGATEIFFS
jgi:hypothetical protein